MTNNKCIIHRDELLCSVKIYLDHPFPKDFLTLKAKKYVDRDNDNRAQLSNVTLSKENREDENSVTKKKKEKYFESVENFTSIPHPTPPHSNPRGGKEKTVGSLKRCTEFGYARSDSEKEGRCTSLQFGFLAEYVYERTLFCLSGKDKEEQRKNKRNKMG